ncbi:hypothetical protein CR513_07270, partial [Mucuna pruriens]
MSNKKNFPPKLKDPGCFTIPYTIDNSHFEKTLFDLGTLAYLQLVDRTITHPLDITEEVLVKVGEFIFHVDFVILDMEEDEVPNFNLTFFGYKKGSHRCQAGKTDLKTSPLSLVSCNCVQDLDTFDGEISGNYRNILLHVIWTE